MNSRSLLVLFSLVGSPVAMAAPGDAEVPALPPGEVKSGASEVFFQGHLMMVDAMKLEQKSDYVSAYYKFKEAKALFDSVHHTQPGWNTEIVEYRRKSTAKDMERVRQLEIRRREEGGAVSPNGVVGRPSGANTDLPAAGPSLSTSALPASTSEVVKEKIKALQDRINEVQARNEQLNRELGAKEADMLAVRKQLLDSRNREKTLQQNLVDEQMKLETAGAGEKRRTQELTRRVKELEGQLQTAMTGLNEANERSDKLLGELQAANNQIKSLTEERDTLVKEREQMAALLIEGGGKGMEKAQILQENLRLKRELAAAQEKMNTLLKEKDADKAQIAELKGQVEAVQADLLALQQKNEDYRQRIAALATRLEDAEKRLVDAAETGSAVMSESVAVQENRVLREIIMQQMKQQARRLRAHEQVMTELTREGVLEKMKEMGAETDGILRSLSEMARPVTLDQKQRSVLSSQNLDTYLGGEGMIVMQDSQAANSPTVPGDIPDGQTPPPPPATGASDKAGLTPELKAYADAAEQFFSEERFEEAENQFRRILLIEPQNIYALCNLGVVQIRRGENEEAVKTLKKSQAYKYEVDRSHYLLGVAYLRLGEGDLAVESIGEGLKINPDNADAHHALGVIHIKRKEWDQARRELEEAVRIDPACAGAHMNLAVIYASKQLRTEALRHYKAARKHGAEPQQDLEDFLGL